MPGFYDGAGIYKIRFMADNEGEWTYTTISSVAELDGQTGASGAKAPAAGSHGPVHVANQFHFAYADGTAYLPFGTTSYAWTHQPLEVAGRNAEDAVDRAFQQDPHGGVPQGLPVQRQRAAFRYLRARRRRRARFRSTEPGRFPPFRTQVAALRDLGIEADIIIFHPYDRWGYCDMSAAQDYRFVAYLAARLAAFRNVWWSLANEYDFLLNSKPMAQWDRYFQIIEENDPYRHLKSIHNGDVKANYDHRKPWVSHVCIQNWDVKRTQEWRDAYGKPVVNDEPEYEGNILLSWGNISAEELVHRYWITLLRGGYAGHGETFMHPEDILWWAKGGVLRGEAWKRIGFLRDLLEQDVKKRPLASGTLRQLALEPRLGRQRWRRHLHLSRRAPTDHLGAGFADRARRLRRGRDRHLEHERQPGQACRRPRQSSYPAWRADAVTATGCGVRRRANPANRISPSVSVVVVEEEARWPASRSVMFARTTAPSP